MPVPKQIFASKEITCVDAGAAGGLSELHKLRKFINLFSFEPLSNSFSELKSNTHLTNQFKGHNVFPTALHSISGIAGLHIANRPSMSSLLEFDEEVFDKHFGFTRGSAGWKKSLLQVKTEKVNVTTLDIWSEENKIQSIDFFKLDTQGTELEILKGAENLLANNKISVIKTEFSNFPVYKNQCLHPELDSFLKLNGFDLVDLIFYPDTVYQSGKCSVNDNKKLSQEPPIGAGGDAVYVLREEFMEPDTALKAGFILGSMGYYGLASELLSNKAGLNKSETEKLMIEIAPKKNFKKKLKGFISPVLIKLYRALKR
jgi:FkbM family methyltransferase